MKSSFKVLAFIVLASSSLAHAASVDWEGWSFDYSTSNNSSGLVLSDVTFNGKEILDKASMPVMRVQYDNDVCGPYADIMSTGALRSATQGAPNNACDNKATCERTFTINDEKILEIGSNWQIGEYQIYQTYYFSENGYLDARVYSRGLQCVVNHSHHAHWMFDFDIDGSANDRVVRADGTIPELEFNDRKSNSAFWRIEDSVTETSVTLTPSLDDGQISDFAQWDLAVRAYNASEVGRWRLGARGEIGNNYNNGQRVNSADSVVWYVSHLPHSASEGADIWHASGPRINVESAISPPPPPPEPPQPPSPTPDNLLANGDFESDKAGWYDCASAANTNSVTDLVNTGNKALLINNGGCLYQEVAAQPGDNLQLSCQAGRSGNNWSIMELGYMNANYQSLDSKVTQIRTSNGYAEHRATGIAPEQTTFALVVLYSEDDTRFDTCVLQNTDESEPNPQPPINEGTNLLANGGFEANLGNWTSCASNSLVSISNDAADGTNSLAVNNGGCLYQEFPVESGTQYTLQCDAKQAGQQYTSLKLAMLGSDYAALASEELPVNTASFAPYSTQVTAPASSRYGTVVVYSEALGNFDSCSVVVN